MFPTEYHLTRVYRQGENIVSRNVAGESLLVPIRGHVADMQKIFALDPVGEFIWNHLDGKLSLNDVLDELLETFPVDRDLAGKDLTEFIDELFQASLIEEIT